ncbi:hypothetical protein GUJ93_ZPchr0002g25166 [Zizania palustris]|uniref:AAA+ ATPase domain-containing protein n=1 Tax=Zizania palustris TaxID=103762 RepID=A0A8J5S5B7_ZIZPA|nr:hypothetical protein GUJ93_ZPchr0002g25166 [Zizania palustris]
MATAAMEISKPPTAVSGDEAAAAAGVKGRGGGGGEGLRQYYLQHIHDLQLQIRQKTHNLNRLEAQRNDLNSRVRMLREELQLLQEPGSYVGEVVKVHPEGKYVVDIDKSIDITKITPSTRVALRNDSYMLHLILPSKVDPLVNLMKVEKVPDSTYDMIGGLDQQIKEIKEVIELPIKHPELFESLGIAQPKGVLLYGPPGTGKTLLARAVAHHTDCTFIRVSGSELVQKYIGEGSRMVRELFVMAREHAPSIIFMDEIDSIGSARMESGTGNGDSEVQRTMLELLNQLDGFEASNKIKVLMATNRIDILDQALLRPGRIDRKIEFPNPNEDSRFDILKIHSRRMNLMRGIDLKKIAEKMNGASGAELKAVCTEAGMFALRERRVHVTQEDFEMAVAKVMKKDTEKNMSLRKLWNILGTSPEWKIALLDQICLEDLLQLRRRLLPPHAKRRDGCGGRSAPTPPSIGFPSRRFEPSRRVVVTGNRMQSLLRTVCRAGSRGSAVKLLDSAASGVAQSGANQSSIKHLRTCSWIRPIGNPIISSDGVRTNGFCANTLSMRGLFTAGNAEVSLEEENSNAPAVEHPPRIKFKRPDKTARHIMNILNKEAVDKVRGEREIPDVQPGCIVQMRLQVPENKRRESTLKGIVIARRNCGINTTFRLRRLVAGVGVESVFPLYSPNIKEIKILDRKKVRRAKLYYLRDRMNALKK